MYETHDGNIKVVVAGLRKSKKDKRSTLLHMLEYVNERDGTNLTPFEFFKDGMYIDEEHSEKLCSHYIDDFYVVNYNGETLEVPSCIVLEPIPFKMGLGEMHKSLLIAVQRSMRNTKDRSVYDIWRQTQKLKSGTSTTIRTLA